jgi:hypothetical protein
MGSTSFVMVPMVAAVGRVAMLVGVKRMDVEASEVRHHQYQVNGCQAFPEGAAQ